MAMIMPSAHEVSPVLQELNHGEPRLAIGLEAIFKPGRPGARNGKRGSYYARSAPRVGSSGGLRSEQRLAETRLEERSVPRWQHQRVARGRDLQDREHRTLGRMQHRHRGVELAYLPHGRGLAEAAGDRDARKIDTRTGVGRLHAGFAVMLVVDDGDREVVRLFRRR